MKRWVSGCVDDSPDWAQAYSYSRTRDQLAAVSAGPHVPEPLSAVPPPGGRLVYVQADRVGPQKLYPLSQIMAKLGEFGTRGEVTWNLLADRQDASAHAGPIVDRRRRLLRRLCAGATDLWSRRGTLYPHLTSTRRRGRSRSATSAFIYPGDAGPGGAGAASRRGRHVTACRGTTRALQPRRRRECDRGARRSHTPPGCPRPH